MTGGYYYYRGTTEGWLGNECLQDQQITCASTDPIVATLFAIECRNYGRGVLLMASMGSFEGREGPANHMSEVECSVNLLVTPAEFAREAVISLDVDEAIEILGRLGHDWLPPRLGGKSALGLALDESCHSDLRLSPGQILEFNRFAFEV